MGACPSTAVTLMMQPLQMWSEHVGSNTEVLCDALWMLGLSKLKVKMLPRIAQIMRMECTNYVDKGTSLFKRTVRFHGYNLGIVACCYLCSSLDLARMKVERVMGLFNGA